MSALRNYLAGLPSGKIENPDQVESLLADCWDELAGRQGGMTAYKLVGRTEEMTWEAPKLTFRIERHGAKALGSAYAEIQSWEVNAETGSATVNVAGKRLVGEVQPRLDVNPLAEAVVAQVVAGATDERLKWYGDSKVRVLVGNIIPAKGPAQTLAGRRKRLRKAIEQRLQQQGWQKTGAHTFVKQQT